MTIAMFRSALCAIGKKAWFVAGVTDKNAGLLCRSLRNSPALYIIPVLFVDFCLLR